MTKRKPVRGRRGGPSGARPVDRAPERLWLYGEHAVLAALGNPQRRCRRLLVTAEVQSRLAPQLAARRDGQAPVQVTAREAFAALLPETAVHQGIAVEVEPLLQPSLEEVAERPAPGRRVIVVLDQVTDPQNVGSILRCAAAFGALAVVTTLRHAAAESAALAKVASGALEQVPYVRVGNLARALEALKQRGYWVLGLASQAGATLAEIDAADRTALVLGSEGAGLRRLTREHCDLFARLPTEPAMSELNVANAAAVALYELLGRTASARRGPPG